MGYSIVTDSNGNPLYNNGAYKLNNLVPENIKKDVVIGGVTGSMNADMLPKLANNSFEATDVPDLSSCPSIRDYLFYQTTSLSKWPTISNSLTTIGSYAFYGSNIDKIELGNNITSIGNYAFTNITNKNIDVTLSENLTYIGSGAFQGINRESNTVNKPFELKLNNETGCVLLDSAFKESALQKITGKTGHIYSRAFQDVDSYYALYNISRNVDLIVDGQIYESAFSNTKKFSKFKIKATSNCTSIRNNAFYNIGAGPRPGVQAELDFRDANITTLSAAYLIGGSNTNEAYCSKSVNFYCPRILTTISNNSVFGNTTYGYGCYVFICSESKVNLTVNINNYNWYAYFFVPYDQIETYRADTNWARVSYIKGWIESAESTELPATTTAGNACTWYSTPALNGTAITTAEIGKSYYCNVATS